MAKKRGKNLAKIVCILAFSLGTLATSLNSVQKPMNNLQDH